MTRQQNGFIPAWIVRKIVTMEINIDDVISPEYLNSFNPPNLPPYKLQLRNNFDVMLIRNPSINEGLCNGIRLQVIELANNLLRGRILTGDKTGDIVFIHRITLYCEETFEKIGEDVCKDVFNYMDNYS